MYKDGENYSFTHRSFQEYFTAYAATHYYPANIDELIKRIPVRHTDSVFSMMYGINAYLIEELYIVPRYLKIKDKIVKCIGMSNTMDFLSSIGLIFTIGFFNLKDKPNSRHLSFIRSSYDVEIREFSNVIQALFKDERANLIDTLGWPIDKMEKLVQWISKSVPSISKLILEKREFAFEFDFEKRTVVCFDVEKSEYLIRKEYPNTQKHIVYKLDENFFSGPIQKKLEEAMKDQSSEIKANLVFAELKARHITRDIKRTRKSGVEVLDL